MNLTSKNLGKNPNQTRTQVFRNALYTYGKRAGTLKVIPGVRNTSVGNFLQNSRRKVYPMARFLGDIQALQSGNFLGQAIGRLGRVGTGAISGRLIDTAVRPLKLSPFFARQARVALGKQFSKSSNKIDRVVKDVTGIVFSGKVKVNGKAANEAVKRNLEVHKEAQRLLEMINARLHAYAPDISSGQYLIGMKDGLKKNQQDAINETVMMSQDRFAEMGLANFQGGNKFIYRDIFGFENPGEARNYLLSSIRKKDVFKARQGENFFFYGEIDVGGSPLFPWVHAVEYGGKLPFYRRKGYKRQGYAEHFYDKPMKDASGKTKNNKGFDKNTYVPDFQYVPPTMFIYRSAADALAAFRKAAQFDYLGDIDNSSTRYYNEWAAIAKKRGGMEKFYANETSFTRVSNTKNIVEDLYAMDKASSRKASFWSSMEQKIPGPRLEMAHGGFYSQELAQSIGLKYVPEELQFSIKIPNIAKDGGDYFSDKFLSSLSKVYVTTGGSRKNIVAALKKEIETNPASGNFLKERGTKIIGGEKSLNRFRRITGNKKLQIGDSAFVYTKKSQEAANRVYDYFRAIEYRHGNKGASPRRTSQYMKKMFDISYRRTGDNLTIYSKRKGKLPKNKTNNATSYTQYDSLTKSFLSDTDIKDIYSSTKGLGF